MAPRKDVLVTRSKVVGPADRFIDVSESHLLEYFKTVLPASDSAALSLALQMIQSLSILEYSRLRRTLQNNFEYFGSATAPQHPDNSKNHPTSEEEEIDAHELNFLETLTKVLRKSHYTLITKDEWEAAQAEDFLLTLPVEVDWSSMDSALLHRYWQAHPEQRADIPEDLADHILLFRRGVGDVQMSGRYISQKVELLIQFWLLGPLWKGIMSVCCALGVKSLKNAPPPPMMESAPSIDRRVSVGATLDIIQNHKHAISVERKTFARAFPYGLTVFKQLFKPITLQEACFKDIIVVYRKAISPQNAPGQFDLLTPGKNHPSFLNRNIHIKQFVDIPLADLEMVMPEKKIFVPPSVFVNLAVTALMGLLAVVSVLRSSWREDGKGSLSVLFSALTLFGTRAMTLYTTINVQKTTIEKTMQRLLYDRCVASQGAVLNLVTEEMAMQRCRELFVAYCILLTSAKQPLSISALDDRCEGFLSRQFGLKLDFTCDEALAKLKEWGLVHGADEALTAVPLEEALKKLDRVWDNWYNGSTATAATPAPHKDPQSIVEASHVAGDSGRASASPKSKGFFSRLKS